MPMRARLSRRVLAVCLSVFVMAVAVLVATSGDNLAARGEQQQSAAAYSEDDYGYGSRLSAEERRGRDTWYFWTGGNEKFWVEMARKTQGNVDLINYVDSRRNGRRFRELGAITQPGCVPATSADRVRPVVRSLRSARRYPTCPANPPASSACASSPTRSSTSRSGTRRSTWPTRASADPPYLIGMSCGFCHIGFNPLNPPADPERPKWSNLTGTIGNQVLGGRTALQPEDEARRLPLARRQRAAAGDIGHLAVRDRPHQQPERDQHRVPAGVPADGRGEDARRHRCARCITS